VPESRTQWAIFLVGLALAATLVAAAIVHGVPGAPVTGVAPAPAVRTHPSPTPPSRSRTSDVVPTAPSTTRRPAHTTRLRLTATADTWLSVRLLSARGRVLFEGTLPAGSSRTFTGAAFWARFGAASNILATVDGRQLRLPGGTYSARITGRGLGPPTA